ncbi:3-oxoacyl-[acyl-carrier-protein] reductase FabG [Baekduia alba]|uniref:SDR family NAD(P)-dependent oxidoreductase n=1 Tax=Baekduia alba TaxID=2997333 RepID=UPI0023423C92|nr:SDR family NAD(P)-dependent oxidoreductase [Baekduia alba]WCB95286.1 3-oxoacyl-[acyl-carrier-protein] reductase FabG [Baekduia alba]
MTGKLEGKVAVVTGAGAGIGRAYAEALAGEGASIVVNDVAGADAVAADIVARGGTAIADGHSVADYDGVAATMAAAVERLGGLDVVIANAGTVRPALVHETDEPDWDSVVGVNLSGTFNCLRHAAPLMAARGGGSIVTVGDISTALHYPLIGTHRAAKAANVVLSLYAADELRGDNINVNVIMPGNTATAMARTYAASLDDERRTRFLTNVRAHYGVKGEAPQGGPSEAASVPPLGVFLCTDAGRSITGRAFAMNGDRIGLVVAREEVTYLGPDAGPGWSVDELSERVPEWLAGLPESLVLCP